jgi:NADPH-dependent 2,4-dienoyl-CoA reductase/sulfur reductase-like enzyme
MQEAVTLETGFGQRVGRHFQDLLEAHGVEVRGGEQVARFEGEGERVERVVCESGLEIAAQAVVLGVGAVPDVMLARAAGLELGERGGVRCDASLRTSAPGIWAAGDVCEYDSVIHGRRLRVEHWEVALAQGRHAARAMLGDEAPYREVPYFFSDLGDWSAMEYVGPAASWDAEVVRGSMEDGAFSVFYGENGRVVATLSVGRPEDIDRGRDLIARGGTIDEI